ncbi:MAG: metallophosphoesterase [Proteobacteria bacterium]|nr:metallophosphoesterase [Pseudomonadota bacterium]
MPSIIRQIYVISDLHVGGRYPDGVNAKSDSWPDRNDRGFRICTHVAELAGFVDSLAQKSATAGPAVELVINGDFVDFLAEEWNGPERWKAFIDDEDQAAARMDEIIDRDRVFFDALANLLARGHRLIVLLGNHDVELSFPRVRRRLETALGVDSGTRFEFLYDGQAYVVGDAIIEHGNRYDAFNVIDHDGLRRVRSSQSRREELHDDHRFRQPAGSKLVAGVMNHLKARFPFIDLLKPEDGAAVPILLALAPAAYSVLSRLDLGKDAARLAVEARRRDLLPGSQSSFAGDISATSTGHTGRPTDLGHGDMGYDDMGFSPAEHAEFQPHHSDDGLRTLLAEQLGTEGADAFARQILDAVPEQERLADQPLTTGLEVDISGDISARSLAGAITAGVGAAVDMGGRVAAVGKLLLARQSMPLSQRIDALYVAIRAVQDDRSFDRSTETKAPYREAAQKLVRRGFRVVVFGHTHLAKRVELSGGLYLNSGTWADLMRFPRDILDKPIAQARTALRRFVETLEKRQFAEYVEFIPTYVRLDLGGDDRVIAAELCDYRPAEG